MGTQFRSGYFRHLVLRKLEPSEYTPNVGSKLIMVIFVHFIQRYSVCSRGSIILQFTPSFLFSFFNIGFWTRLLKLCVHVTCCITSHYTATWEICNLIGSQQWYFQLFLKYLHVKITKLFRVIV